MCWVGELEIGRGVRLCRRVIAFEGTLEGTASAGVGGCLALLCSTRAAESIAIANQVFVLLVASLLATQPPEK